ncbi:cobalamin synthase [compost metagenome]
MLLFYFAKAPAPALILSLIAFVATVAAFGRLATRKIGGHTGDTIGATQQLTEIAVLGALALTV